MKTSLPLLLAAFVATLGLASSAEPPPPEAAAPAQNADQRFSEALEVRLAQMYVTVTDREGQLVTNLSKDDFILRENGVEQALDDARPSFEQPVTLGVAIDTSASMFIKLAPTTRAAGSLIGEMTLERDRAFLVGFGPVPTVVAPTTGNLAQVKDALRNLEALGRTPLWESISVSLDELAKAEGKKALVVFLDGADSDGSRAYRACLRKARQAGAPVYLIVINNEAARSKGKDFQTRSFISRLEKVAAAGGGDVFYVPTQGDLTPIYQRIEAEIRNAYLLTYYPKIPLSAGGERQVEVQVKKRGLKVRSLTQYEPGS